MRFRPNIGNPTGKSTRGTPPYGLPGFSRAIDVLTGIPSRPRHRPKRGPGSDRRAVAPGQDLNEKRLEPDRYPAVILTTKADGSSSTQTRPNHVRREADVLRGRENAILRQPTVTAIVSLAADRWAIADGISGPFPVVAR